MTENKGTAPEEMAPVNSHGKKSSTDREIAQHSKQQKSKIGEKGEEAKGKLMKLPAGNDLAGHEQRETY